ncbi:hypothetical protein AVEN_248687-1 [Araneus ventricosus]|uniref:Uncharacterized protein n=1 Tax=Araneus ventricosus TaxID=182803 RepID=A0A4Y2C0U1_ARAVE|nr:hypothetical protein AVEN_248687-1 [Araneus ventricosus]
MCHATILSNSPPVHIHTLTETKTTRNRRQSYIKRKERCANPLQSECLVSEKKAANNIFVGAQALITPQRETPRNVVFISFHYYRSCGRVLQHALACGHWKEGDITNCCFSLMHFYVLVKDLRDMLENSTNGVGLRKPVDH